MKPATPWTWLLGLATLLIAGCVSSSQMGRIDAHRDLYEQWPVEIRQAVLEGRVESGMTPDMVALALGKPTQVVRRTSPSGSGSDTVWIYRPVVFPDDGSSRTLGASGPVLPPIGSTLPPSHQPIVDREIVFRDGVVIRADPAPEK